MNKIRTMGLKSILTVVIALLAIGGSVLTFAMIDESNSVHINAKEIEDSTLIVGTHLIYLGSMNDQIYEIAMESASEADQHNRYYKSELADGTWYDVTDGGVLADITTAGRIVENREIEALFMTHHTKSDGITYDLRTGQPVCIFDINDPYDLEGLDELEPIKLQYDVMAQTSDKTDTNKRDMKLIEEIYGKDRTNDITEECDEQISQLQTYYEMLVQNDGDPEMSDMVMSVMEKIDARRRAEVLLPLQETELENLSRIVSKDYTYREGEVFAGWNSENETSVSVNEDGSEEVHERPSIEDYALNLELVNGISEAISNVQESYIEHSSNMLVPGSTVLTQVEYELSVTLARRAAAENYSGCDETTMKLIYLQRINDGVIREGDVERDFIQNELIGKEESAYRASLSAGEGEAYKALSSTAAAAVKANALKQQKNDTEILRNELQFVIQAYIDRLAVETAMEHISQRIDDCDSYRRGIKGDAYESYAQSSVDAHLEWLQQTLTSLQDSLGNRTMDHLKEQKDDLLMEKMEALDKNQLGVAKKLDAQIAAVDQEIQDLTDQLNAIIQSDNTTAAEKAQAAAALGDDALQNMKNNVLEDIRNGELDGVDNLIDGIGALAGSQPEGALNALKDIYEELSDQALAGSGDGSGTGDGSGAGAGSAALNDLLAKVEDVTTEQMANFVGTLSENDLEDLIRAYVEENGSSDDAAALLENQDLLDLMNGLSDEMLAALLAGLDMYADETGNADAKSLVGSLSKTAFGDGNIYVYSKLSGQQGVEYIPTDRIGKACRYRYIFNDSQKAVTLQKGSEYYRFTAFSAVVDRGGTLEDMSRAAGFQRTVYLIEDAAQSYFKLETEYLTDSSYAVLLTENMSAQALEFLDYLLQAGGEA